MCRSFCDFLCEFQLTDWPECRLCWCRWPQGTIFNRSKHTDEWGLSPKLVNIVLDLFMRLQGLYVTVFSSQPDSPTPQLFPDSFSLFKTSASKICSSASIAWAGIFPQIACVATLWVCRAAHGRASLGRRIGFLRGSTRKWVLAQCGTSLSQRHNSNKVLSSF